MRYPSFLERFPFPLLGNQPAFPSVTRERLCVCLSPTTPADNAQHLQPHHACTPQQGALHSQASVRAEAPGRETASLSCNPAPPGAWGGEDSHPVLLSPGGEGALDIANWRQSSRGCQCVRLGGRSLFCSQK